IRTDQVVHVVHRAGAILERMNLRPGIAAGHYHLAETVESVRLAERSSERAKVVRDRMNGAVGRGSEGVRLKRGRIAVPAHLPGAVDRQCGARRTAERAQVIACGVDYGAVGSHSERVETAGPKTAENAYHLAGVIDTVSLAIAAEGNNARIGAHSKSLELMRLDSTTIAGNLARAVDRCRNGR